MTEGSSANCRHWAEREMMEERVEKNINKFWLQVSGYDTYHRGTTYARLDTPWNAFTRDKSALINTLWSDRIVDVLDQQSGTVRRFVRLGDPVGESTGSASKRRRQARQNLDEAVRERTPIYGYEAEPNQTALERGDRAIKHFWLDRVHRLRPIIGLSLESMEQSLGLDAAFQERFHSTTPPSLNGSILFELTDPSNSMPPTFALPSEDESNLGLDEDDLLADDEDLSTSERQARLALPILVSHVLAQRDGVLIPLTYLELAELLDRRTHSGTPWARGLGRVLGLVSKLIASATAGWPFEVPFLTTIVVLSRGPNRGLPDEGIVGRWTDYDTLTRDQKRAKLSTEYDRILRFGGLWNDVLKRAGFEPIEPCLGEQKGPKLGGWAGGESKQHKALKAYVSSHPAEFGAHGCGWISREEYALLSGDEIDVFFETPTHWIGVEVKSMVSDAMPDDYRRGIFQVVKYRAVLQAQAEVSGRVPCPKVDVMLVLQGRLPQEYQQLASTLGVHVRENVGAGMLE